MSNTNSHHRIVIYAKDVMKITGKDNRACYRILKNIRSKFNLSKEEFITIDHFCQYTGIKEDRVKHFLLD